MRRFREPSRYSFLKSNIQNGDIFIDVGSGYGEYIFLLMKDILPKGMIFAFEPIEHQYRSIVDNIFKSFPEYRDLNRVKIFLENFAILDKKSYGGKLTRNDFENSVYISNDLTNFSGLTFVNTLDSYFLGKNLFSFDNKIYIKLDVEGNEVKVIKGGIEFLRKINQGVLIIETHGTFLDRYSHLYGDRVLDMCNILNNLGYKINFQLEPESYNEGSLNLNKEIDKKDFPLIFESNLDCILIAWKK